LAGWLVGWLAGWPVGKHLYFVTDADLLSDFECVFEIDA
jgi:hypothetical protein